MSNTNLDNKNQVDDIVSMLDNMFANGHGHVDVSIDDNKIGGKTVETMGSVDCSKNPMACSVPTLKGGIDGSDDDY